MSFIYKTIIINQDYLTCEAHMIVESDSFVYHNYNAVFFLFNDTTENFYVSNLTKV